MQSRGTGKHQGQPSFCWRVGKEILVTSTMLSTLGYRERMCSN